MLPKDLKYRRGNQMRILHTSDWHIGKRIHGASMIEDQKHILDQLLNLLEKESIDVLLMAGDIYDRSIPPTEAVELLDQTLSRIVLDLGVKVIIIAGNHDSPDRLDFGSKILKDQGLYIVGRYQDNHGPIVLDDDYGSVSFYPVPYLEPAVIKAYYALDQTVTHDDAIEIVLDKIKGMMNTENRNICISHSFVVGSEQPETSESERPLSIGGSEYVKAHHFDAFDYVALGHLHRPQKVGRQNMRYAGSLLKYSFSEAKQKKSVTLIDLKEKGNMQIQTLTLKPKRDLRIIQGELNQLLEKEVYTLGNTDDYIYAILTDQNKLYEPMQKLRTIYPNILQLERENIESNEGYHHLENQQIASKNPEELFESFYHQVTGLTHMSKAIKQSFQEVYQQVIEEERDNA